MFGALRGDSDRGQMSQMGSNSRYTLSAYANVAANDDESDDEDDEILDEKPFVSVKEEEDATVVATGTRLADEEPAEVAEAAVEGDSRGYKKNGKKRKTNKAQFTKANRKNSNKTKKEANKAVKKAKNQLKRAQKDKKNAHRFAEVIDDIKEAGTGEGPGAGPGADSNRNLAALFAGFEEDNLHQLKVDLLTADPENADRIRHLIAKKEKKRRDKSIQMNQGTWKQKVNHPHRGSQRGMDGFAMEIAIDLRKARSDGKCGKSTNWAPCPLVPINGNVLPTSCCNFDTNHCLASWQCDCPHCVDYAQVNQATVEVKKAMAEKTYSDDVNGLVLRNRDLFHLWAVENVFQPKLMKDVLIKLNEQSTNVLNHIHNAADNECLSRGKAVDKKIKLPLMMKILALQRDHRYTDVLKQIIMSFVSQKPECVQKLGNSFHKVDKIQSAIQKAVMKMQNDLAPGQRKQMDVPAHFMPEHSRKERRIIANSVQMPPQ
jgi:hypothetical protein